MVGKIFFAKMSIGLRLVFCVLFIALCALPARSVQADAPAPVVEPVLVTDLRKGEGDSSPKNLAAIGSTLFFNADNGSTGKELYKTSPPYNTIQLVADICPGLCGSSPWYLSSVGDTLFFSAYDIAHGTELWKSEPPYTQATTYLVADINENGDSFPMEMTPIGTAIFFSADDGHNGRELWKSNSPYTTATLIKDISPGDPGSNPHNLVRIGWMLFFFADDSTGAELWRSDPAYNSGSTFRVTNINPDGSANPSDLTALDLKLFFSATDGSSGQELWMIESPYNESRRVTDLAGRPGNSNPTDLYAVGETLFFTADITANQIFTLDAEGNRVFLPASHGPEGTELYRSEPPYESTYTYLVEDINPAVITPATGASSNPEHKYAIGSNLFFTANNGKHGTELWISEPPYLKGNTHEVEDINEGEGSSNPTEMIGIGTTLFFAADNGRDGMELWKSTPPYTPETTDMVSDVFHRSGNSNPHNFFVLDNTLFFAAENRPDGKELFRYGGYYGIPRTGFAPGVVTRVAAQPESKGYRAMGGLELNLPALGISTEIVGVPNSTDGWDLAWLANQVGYLDGSAYPTWNGNSVLTAHSYLSNGKPGPFANLSKLKYGSQVVIGAYGQRYIYEVREIATVKPTEAQAVFKHEERPWLTLVTCQGYDEAKNEYLTRLVVRAVLVKMEAKK